MIACLQTILIALVTLSLLAQSPPKRKKLKDFGSSLKRLKWNPEKNAAIEQDATFDEGDVIRIDTSLVSSDLLVLDQHGKSVAGLTADDFAVAEDGAPQTVGHFLNGDNVSVPRTIVLIIDYSGSQMPYLMNSVKAAKVLVDKLAPRDLMAIVTDDVELILDFTSDKKKLKKALDSLVERTQRHPYYMGKQLRIGRSQQYSALMATLNEAFGDEDVRPIIIFQTDGDEAYFLRNPVIKLEIPDGLEGDTLRSAQQSLNYHTQHLLKNETEFSLDDVYRAVEKSRATVYTVVPGVKLTGLTPEVQMEKFMADEQLRLKEMLTGLSFKTKARVKDRMDRRDQSSDIMRRWTIERTAKLQSALSVVAPLTGGWTEYLETPEQAEDIYARIFSDINQRYIVGYYPTNKERDGKRRKIEFKVKGHPEYQVYGRLSYFAPGP
jgi:VWFA-related protein